ncbi:MAG: translation initiation factor IF-3 [candidate division WOR-3 bacterium]|nr:translation initiation factor IF-3 [candidate division WOR-3 bacterium]MCX7757258.1 translation initiation factor IF-3 [candidate division WOR-3 bacterium]MDW7987710.1 translation initiation factor IF-3 [candidate division WOR-3 bacterium]
MRNKPRANEQIRAPFVRLIGPDKKVIGIMPTKEALKIARSQGLDLVEIAPNAEPPVCGIVDLGKYLYELKIKEKQAKKKQHTSTVREIRFSMNISENDYQVKLNKIKEFLLKHDRVRVSLPMRGREVLHKSLGLDVINRIIEDLKDIAAPENPPKIIGEGKQVIQVVLVPR